MWWMVVVLCNTLTNVSYNKGVLVAYAHIPMDIRLMHIHTLGMNNPGLI